MFYGATADEARGLADDLRHELRLAGPVSAPANLTLGEYLADWIERNRTRVRPSTWRTREMYVRVYLTPALGKVPLVRLRPPDVERALALFMAKGRPERVTRPQRGHPSGSGIAGRTARHIRATLRAALADAVREGLVIRNVAADAHPPAVEDREINYLSAPQVRTLLDATAEHEYGPVYAVLVSTGLRLGEALGLRWADIDLERGTLTVRHSLALDATGKAYELAAPKTKKSRRTLPLPTTARAALMRQRGRQDQQQAAAGAAWRNGDGLVFTDAVGRHADPSRVSVLFQRARASAGLPEARLADLRHSAATIMLAEGVPLAVISATLGHSGVAITMQHYAAVVPELLTAAADAMERALGTERAP
ncbi:MAG: site-specific integrase [Candidatus Limnocylindrales bacterium]